MNAPLSETMILASNFLYLAAAIFALAVAIVFYTLKNDKKSKK
jgi:hypothetical protein